MHNSHNSLGHLRSTSRTQSLELFLAHLFVLNSLGSIHLNFLVGKFWILHNHIHTQVSLGVRLLSKYFYLQPFFLKDWLSLLYAKSVSSEVPLWWALKGEILTFASPDPWKMHFQHTFRLQRTSCPWLINTIFLCEYYSLVIKYMESHHPNRCIKVSNKPPKAALFVVYTIFFVTRHDQVIWPCLVQTFPFYVWANIVQFQ